MIKLVNSALHNEQQSREELAGFILSASQLSFGPQCQEFERRFATYQGRKDAIFVNSGSSANFAIVQALLNLGRLKSGDEVGFSAVTWSTNVSPLMVLGLKPIPVDVDLETLNVSSKTFEQALTKHPKMKMLFVTNLLGFCDDLDAVVALADKHGIIVVEDNCESLGSVYKNKKLGNFGVASTFSFFVGHHMSTIEGGMVCTDDEELARMVRMVRAHGWDRNLAPADQKRIRAEFKVKSAFYAKYTFYAPGYNFRPTEINGFLGNQQLQYMDFIAQQRFKNFRRLAEAIYARTDLYYPIRYSHMDVFSNFAVPVICREQKVLDDLVRRCEGVVEVRPIVAGDITKQPFFQKCDPKSAKEFERSNAATVHTNGMYFANNQELTEADLQILLSLFAEV